MIDRRLVVQLEAAIAEPPVVADTLLAVDDQRPQADPLQLDGNRDAGMAAADNEHIRLAVVIRRSHVAA
jgi:hypothetical protein